MGPGLATVDVGQPQDPVTVGRELVGDVPARDEDRTAGTGLDLGVN